MQFAGHASFCHFHIHAGNGMVSLQFRMKTSSALVFYCTAECRDQFSNAIRDHFLYYNSFFHFDAISFQKTEALALFTLMIFAKRKMTGSQLWAILMITAPHARQAMFIACQPRAEMPRRPRHFYFRRWRCRDELPYFRCFRRRLADAADDIGICLWLYQQINARRAMLALLL